MRMKEILWRLPLAIVSGLLALYAFPTEGIWVFAPLIPALLAISVAGTGFWWGSGLGFLAGLVFYIAHIEWIALYLGPLPLIALATLQSFFYAAGAGLIAKVWSSLQGRRLAALLFALAVASIWTAREWVSTNFPYGGFPWSRLSMTQAEAPSANLVAYLGMSGLTFAVALAGAILAGLWLTRRQLGSLGIGFGVVVSAGIMVTPMLLPVGFTRVTGEITVLAVQGNANAGLFSNVERGRILQNHLDATNTAFAKIQDPSVVDLVVWPENASDKDPLRHEDAYAAIDSLTARYDVPLAFGTITKRSESYFNSTLFWLPNQGIVDYYDKKRPVPFAEYVPDRPFWRMLAPELIDLISRGYEFGTRDGVFELNDSKLGTLICFEVAVDDIPRNLVNDGAELILSQTNNADFGFSDETYQQVAIAKLRAIETGRTVVNISTVGKSAIYRADGSQASELEWYKSDAMLAKVELRAGLTPGVVLAQPLEILNSLIVAAMAIALWWSGRSNKPKQRVKSRRRR